MSKDIVFNKKPKRKPISYAPAIRASTYPLSFNRPLPDIPQASSFKEDAIDLNNYRILKPNELLQRGDLQFSKEAKIYYETCLVGKPQPPYGPYYRRKELDGYKLLGSKDILQDGDEFCIRDGVWYPTGNVGQTAGEIHKYRRPIKGKKPHSYFSDQEIEEAKQYYGVSHKVPML